MSKPSIEWDTLEKLVQEIVEGQKKKLLQCGRSLVPSLTPEDVLQPNDFPELENHPYFRYEEGMVAGMQTIQIALQALKQDLYVFPSK